MSYSTKNPMQFIKWMMNHDVQDWDDISDFLNGYASRKYRFEKIILRVDSIENFLTDLEKNKLLIIEKPKTFFSLFQ